MAYDKRNVDNEDREVDRVTGVVPAHSYSYSRNVRPKQPTSLPAIIIGAVATIAMLALLAYVFMVFRGTIPKPAFLMYDATPSTAEAMDNIADLSGVSESQVVWFPDENTGTVYEAYKQSILDTLAPVDRILDDLAAPLAEGGIPDLDRIKSQSASAIAQLNDVQTKLDAIALPVGMPEDSNAFFSSAMKNAQEIVSQSLVLAEQVGLSADGDTARLGEANFAAANVKRSRDDLLSSFTDAEKKLGMVVPAEAPAETEAAAPEEAPAAE